jgi:hypothetical protein
MSVDPVNVRGQRTRDACFRAFNISQNPLSYFPVIKDWPDDLTVPDKTLSVG